MLLLINEVILMAMFVATISLILVWIVDGEIAKTKAIIIFLVAATVMFVLISIDSLMGHQVITYVFSIPSSFFLAFCFGVKLREFKKIKSKSLEKTAEKKE